jgi:hypothetical protein
MTNVSLAEELEAAQQEEEKRQEAAKLKEGYVEDENLIYEDNHE